MLASCETLLIEDDPYGELYFGRRPPRPIAVLAPKQTIYITSLSKIVGPALRLGIVVAEAELIEQLARVKTGMDLCTSAMTQGIAAEVLASPCFNDHLANTRRYYARQARLMQAVLKRYMPKYVSWTHPQGGMFVWLTLPMGMDTATLYEQAIAQDVAFVPGYIFRSNRGRSSSLRLSFSLSSREQLDQGIKILANLVRDSLKGGEQV